MCVFIFYGRRWKENSPICQFEKLSSVSICVFVFLRALNMYTHMVCVCMCVCVVIHVCVHPVEKCVLVELWIDFTIDGLYVR